MVCAFKVCQKTKKVFFSLKKSNNKEIILSFPLNPAGRFLISIRTISIHVQMKWIAGEYQDPDEAMNSHLHEKNLVVVI